VEGKIQTGSLSSLSNYPGPDGPEVERLPGDSPGGSDPQSRPLLSVPGGQALIDR